MRGSAQAAEVSNEMGATIEWAVELIDIANTRLTESKRIDLNTVAARTAQALISINRVSLYKVVLSSLLFSSSLIVTLRPVVRADGQPSAEM